MNNLFKQMDKDWNTMLDAMRATGAIIKEGEMVVEPEVFGLNGKEEMLANKEAESEADKAIRISEEKADWDSSFGYDEWRDNQD